MYAGKLKKEKKKTWEATVGYFNVLHSDSDTAPIYTLPHSHCAHKSPGREIPYPILQGKPQ
jgi:hypothetical protein